MKTVKSHGVQRQLPFRVVSEVKQSEALRTSWNLRSHLVSSLDARTNRGLVRREFSGRVRRVRLRNTVVAHLTKPHASVPLRSPEVVRKTTSFIITRIFNSRTARAERDCSDGQERHSPEDVGTARVVLGGVSVGQWVLGTFVLYRDCGNCLNGED